MVDASILGVADVPDADLAAMVSRRLGVDGPNSKSVDILEASAEIAAYDLEALTTAGRFRVRGRARTPAGDRDFAFFVKVVQSWARSPLFAVVPAELREMALAMVPWRVEPLIYRSDLSSRLPDGLSMPAAAAVFDLDDESAAVWMEEVDFLTDPWDLGRFARAAGLLGRLAASERIRPLARLGHREASRTIRDYALGRVTHQLLPALRGDEVWHHPLVAAAFDDELRADLRAAADDLWSVVEELESLPVGTSHGDACTRNLLVERGSDQLVLIDYGFWGEAPLGFDLGQLLLGEVQLGERPAGELPGLEARCLPAFVKGLREEGCTVAESVIQRAHALQMLLFSALSAIPFELLGAPPTPARRLIAEQRAASARFILDLVTATG